MFNEKGFKESRVRGVKRLFRDYINQKEELLADFALGHEA